MNSLARLFIVSLSLFILGTTTITHAQISDADIEDRLSLTLSPEYPQPGDTVTITAKSYSVDLMRSTITWFVNGKSVQTSIGGTTYQMLVNGGGKETRIQVQITSNGGVQITNDVVINPGSVDVLWQAESYTPPFYKGKAQPAFQGNILFVAQPTLVKNGTVLDPKNLIYTWKRNGEVLQSSSGYGKNTLKVSTGVIVRPLDVEVTVSSLDGIAKGVGRTTVIGKDPQVAIYEESPLYGILYNRAVPDEVNLTLPEIWLHATPYFFSTTIPHKSLVSDIQWNINNTPSVSQNNEGIVLRQPGDVAGTSEVSVKISNGDKILQYISKTIHVVFKPQ